MRKIVLILFLVSVILVGSCSNTTENEIEVTYEISGGLVPYEYRDWRDTLIFKNDGTVTREYKFGNQTTRQIKLSDKEIKEFKDLIIRSNVFNFNDEYNCIDSSNSIKECILDAPGISIKFVINGKTKLIRIDNSINAPDEIRLIIDKLDYFKQKLKL
jgi:hypothetical protein